MERYEVTVGLIGKDIILDAELTNHDYSGYIAEKWTLNGVVSRLSGPAITIFRATDMASVCPNETLAEFWYLDGMFHSFVNSGKPAYYARDPEYLYEEFREYKNGVLHNEFGAAVRNQFERQYFLYGEEFSEEAYQKRLSELRSLNHPPRPL